jgi:hypothetical protein
VKQQPSQHNNSGAQPAGKWFILVVVLPLLLAFGLAMSLGGASNEVKQPPAEVAVDDGTRATGRLVVIIVDSLRPKTLEDDQLMPSLHAFARRPDSTYLPMQTCKANFTLPCIQTMFEGRQSPFIAGLHNFTGQVGSQASLPGTLAAAGYNLAMISDHTLDSLYAAHANISLNVQQWKGKNHLDLDLMALDRGEKILDEGDADALLLHIVGTDKSAHKDQPGSERYRRHFRTVDKALSELLDSFDFDRDNLLIVGDHGHGPLGHHNSNSVAIFAGQTYQGLFDQLPNIDAISQTDLLYFMSYPMLLPVPVTYEGEVYAPNKPTKHLASNQPSKTHLAKFLDLQQRILEDAGVPEGLSVREGMAKLREAHAAERFDPIFKYTPLLLLFALFIAHLLGTLRTRTATNRPAPRIDTRILLALVAAAVPVAFLTSAESGLWLCVPILIGAGVAFWRQSSWNQAVSYRDHLFVLLLVAGAASTGLYASEWSHYFHTTGAIQPSIVVFYALLFGAGALLAAQYFGSLRHLAYGTMAAALFVLPSGLYYYQAAQNILLGAFIGALAVGLWWLLAHTQQRKQLVKKLSAPLVLSATITALTAFFLVWQEAGGWEWHLYAVIWMRRLGPVVTFGILGLIIGYWMWAARHWTGRASVLVLGVATAFLCVGLGELPAEMLVGSLLPSLFLVGLLDVERRLGLTGASPRDDQQNVDLGGQLRRGLLVAALVIISLWIATSGFLLQNIDFSFALDWFSTYFARERDVFLFTFLATFLKYGLPPATIIIALYTVGRRHDFRPVIWGASAFLGLKVFLLLVQIFAGSTAQAEKYGELMVSELLFVYPLAVAVPLLYLAIWGVAALARKNLK